MKEILPRQIVLQFEEVCAQTIKRSMKVSGKDQMTFFSFSDFLFAQLFQTIIKKSENLFRQIDLKL